MHFNTKIMSNRARVRYDNPCLAIRNKIGSYETIARRSERSRSRLPSVFDPVGCLFGPSRSSDMTRPALAPPDWVGVVCLAMPTAWMGPVRVGVVGWC